MACVIVSSRLYSNNKSLPSSEVLPSCLPAGRYEREKKSLPPAEYSLYERENIILTFRANLLAASLFFILIT